MLHVLFHWSFSFALCWLLLNWTKRNKNLLSALSCVLWRRASRLCVVVRKCAWGAAQTHAAAATSMALYVAEGAEGAEPALLFTFRSRVVCGFRFGASAGARNSEPTAFVDTWRRTEPLCFGVYKGPPSPGLAVCML